VSFVEYLKTPIGFLKIQATDDAINAIAFVGAGEANNPNELTKRAANQLSEYFAGKRTKFSLPLAQSGSEFQQHVWRLLAEIPFGKALTYLQLAELFGNAKAIRAVAAANAKNQFAIVVPCHRVIGADGALTGYAWGLEKKEWLLRHEGALPETLF